MAVKPLTFLVVEDDEVAAEYVRKGLMEAGHVVDLAADGDMGLEMARAAEYDALILDRMMPKMDGLEMLAELREDGDSTPVLILSALGEVDHRVEGLRAGGDDYLAKPYAFSELLARVEAIGRRTDPTAAVTKLKVGELEMDLLDADKNCEDLSQKVVKHLTQLAETVENPKNGLTRVFRMEHGNLEDDISHFAKTFKIARKDVMAVTEHVLQSEHWIDLKHHLAHPNVA